ncbi:unnamed protein product, partial [Closterium sp. NIES-54]
KDVGGFPFRTHGRIMAPILLVDLHKHAGGKGQHAGASAGLHLVVVSFDGFLYAVDGRTGCADTFDIGETSYSMVLAENVDGGDDLDLVVSTMNGAVYCFQTSVQYHPLKVRQNPLARHSKAQQGSVVLASACVISTGGFLSTINSTVYCFQTSV